MEPNSGFRTSRSPVAASLKQWSYRRVVSGNTAVVKYSVAVRVIRASLPYDVNVVAFAERFV